MSPPVGATVRDLACFSTGQRLWTARRGGREIGVLNGDSKSGRVDSVAKSTRSLSQLGY
ncbi:unnamed protein product [Arabis nemorensis]|uniref:Uncharacterized protein n=1 Tax=Arabis nemorensis TaxID=586526 RepID=A0A565CG04_9BRAS|nr:unnamed protein product [Arabis nemorensis]